MDKSYVGMDCCVYCGEPKGILLDTRMRNTLGKLNYTSWEPCDTCKEQWSQGVALVEVKYPPEKGEQPPVTGTVVVLKDEAFVGIFNQPVPPKRICFVEVGICQELRKQAGIPDGVEINNTTVKEN